MKSGNFFESIPNGADAHLLKNTLHDWSDEDCLRILKNIYAAAEPRTKLLVVLMSEAGAEFAPVFRSQVGPVTPLTRSTDGRGTRNFSVASSRLWLNEPRPCARP